LIDKPDGQYKFGSIGVNLDPTYKVINRNAYGILDWLGDIGGLNDALYTIVNILLVPFL